MLQTNILNLFGLKPCVFINLSLSVELWVESRRHVLFFPHFSVIFLIYFKLQPLSSHFVHQTSHCGRFYMLSRQYTKDEEPRVEPLLMALRGDV